MNQVQQAMGCFSSIKAESNRPCCVRLVWFWSWSPAYLALVGSLALWLWLDNTAPPPLPLFAVKVRDSKEEEKNVFCSDKYKYTNENTLANKNTLCLNFVVLHFPQR